MYFRKTISSLLLVSALPLGVQAQTSLFSVSSDADAYQCLNPNPPKCISLNQDPAQCPGCSSWGAVFLQLKSSDFAMDIQGYSYATGLPRANVMIKDASNQIFHVPYPVTSAGDPVKVSDLYANPESYGWLDVKGGEVLPGAVALWPNVGGMLVEVDSGGKAEDDEPSQVLYPSDANDGMLIIRKPESLNSLGTPKFIVPEAAVQLRAAPQ